MRSYCPMERYPVSDLKAQSIPLLFSGAQFTLDVAVWEVIGRCIGLRAAHLFESNRKLRNSLPVWRIAFIALIFAGSSPALAGNPLLLLEQAECLRDNAEEYSAFVAGPTLIFPGFCEEGNFNPTPSEVASATSQNSAYAGIGASTIDFGDVDPAMAERVVKLSGNTKASMMVMSPEMLNCLSERFDEITKTWQFDTDASNKVNIAELLVERCE